jgi:hypothetical protein
MLDFPNFRNLYAFERILIFEISCPVFGIRRQGFAEFAVDLGNATPQLRKADLEFAISSWLFMSDGIRRRSMG